MLQIDLYNPDFYIDCKDLTAASNIYGICRTHGIKKNFVYAIAYRKSAFIFWFLKVGMSYPVLSKKRRGSVGERLARQIAWFPGWDKNKKPGTSHGVDLWLKVEQAINNGTLPNIDRKDLVVGVWDIAKRTRGNKQIKSILDLNDWRPDAPTKWAEGELSRQHAEIYGWRPTFNEIDPANNKVYKGHIDPEAFQKHFT